MTRSSRSAAERSTDSALTVLTPAERGEVLDRLLAERPELAAEAERLAAGLLSSASIDQTASAVEAALTGISMEALAARAGRFQGGYVDENEAAWALVGEAVKPFRADLERRAALGHVDAAASMVVGIVVGLYRVREPEMGTVLAYAGEDAPYDHAVEVLALATRLGVDVSPDLAAFQLADWTNLW